MQQHTGMLAQFVTAAALQARDLCPSATNAAAAAAASTGPATAATAPTTPALRLVAAPWSPLPASSSPVVSSPLAVRGASRLSRV